MAAMCCCRRSGLFRCLNVRLLLLSVPQRHFYALKSSRGVLGSTELLLKVCKHRNKRCQRWSSDEPPTPRDAKVQNVSIILSRGPIRWISNKIKLFLVRSYFDADFDETTFLEGAKQAICTVSTLASQKKFHELEGLLTTEAIESVRDDVMEKELAKTYEITMKDILQIVIQDIGFQYDEVEKGRKWLHVLVSYICQNNDEYNQKDVGNVTLIRIPFPKITRYSFRKECTKGAEDGWIITKVIHMNQDGLPHI